MKNIFLYILLPIFMSVCGEFILKYSVGGQPLGINFNTLQFIVNTPSVFLGIGLISGSAFLWIIGMSQFQLSFMYPFLSLSYVIIIVGSEFLLNEQVGINRYISILFIIVGLVIISRSQNVKIKE